MSNVDTAWLRMESPTNLMMITGVWMLGSKLTLKKLKRVIVSRFLAYRRFRQKAVDDGSAAFWQTDEEFDIDWHVQSAMLPGKGDKIALENYVSQMASTALDHARPLWQFHLVENYDGGCAVIQRIHHCYADGIALMQVVLSLTDAAPKPSERSQLTKVWKPHDQGSVFERLVQPARAGLGKALAFGGKAIQKGGELIRDPALVAAIAKESGEITRELAIALSLSDDPPTAFKGTLGGTKRCAWADPLPLEEVKTIGKTLGCTVNDVLLACASGALRSYLRSIGDDVEGLTIPATARTREETRQSLRSRLSRPADRRGQSVASPRACCRVDARTETFAPSGADVRPACRGRHGSGRRAAPRPRILQPQGDGCGDQRSRPADAAVPGRL
jgi:WS/DGAT/MGAT family acyltransferase